MFSSWFEFSTRTQFEYKYQFEFTTRLVEYRVVEYRVPVRVHNPTGRVLVFEFTTRRSTTHLRVHNSTVEYSSSSSQLETRVTEYLISSSQPKFQVLIFEFITRIHNSTRIFPYISYTSVLQTHQNQNHSNNPELYISYTSRIIKFMFPILYIIYTVSLIAYQTYSINS